jgi:hypothetical protein
MAGDAGDPTEAGGATVADSPKALGVAGDPTTADSDDGPPTAHRPRPDPRPTPNTAAIGTPVDGSTTRTTTGPSLATSVTTAAAALRDEEVQRTRWFIAMGWAISLVGIGTTPFLATPRAMDILFIAAMLLGIAVSVVFHQRFADPRRYSERSLMILAMVSVINAHVAILYYGTFSIASLIVVLGLHFVARTEAIRAARSIYAAAAICHAAIAGLVISGIIDDPGAFASERDVGRGTLIAGAIFVQALYFLAYYSARVLRSVSLRSIEGLQRATRLASQREALMLELRADLERALRVGGPGRHTDQVLGQFKLGVVLGRGAMGEVYDAVHTGTAEAAAVKLLRRELLADPTHVARFLREAKAGGALASPHVVKVLEASTDDAPTPYLAMERLHGHTLAELLRRDGRLDPAELVELASQVGAGVDAAAAAGIVHRDLKPQNLFRCDGAVGLWKILDFGVATLAEDSGTLTQGGVVGTPSYMAPEQAQGKRVDARADVYAIAAVVYRCLTGRHPFTGTDTPALLYAVVHKMPVRPGALIDAGPDVDRWTAIALAKDPAQRFPTGTALAAALAAAVRGELDGKLRKQADVLIRKWPWDTGT